MARGTRRRAMVLKALERSVGRWGRRSVAKVDRCSVGEKRKACSLSREWCSQRQDRLYTWNRVGNISRHLRPCEVIQSYPIHR